MSALPPAQAVKGQAPGSGPVPSTPPPPKVTTRTLRSYESIRVAFDLGPEDACWTLVGSRRGEPDTVISVAWHVGRRLTMYPGGGFDAVMEATRLLNDAEAERADDPVVSVRRWIAWGREDGRPVAVHKIQRIRRSGAADPPEVEDVAVEDRAAYLAAQFRLSPSRP